MREYPKNPVKVNRVDPPRASIIIDGARVRILGRCECGRPLRAHDVSVDYEKDDHGNDHARTVRGVCAGCHTDFLFIEFDEG